MKIFKLYSDPSHGWLAVKKDFVRNLGLLEKISTCSYEKGKTLYLEEDQDAKLFLNALKAKGYSFLVKEKLTNKLSPIRNYKQKSND